jgi:hypothetical protein
MSVEDPQDLAGIDQAIRINELKETARELAGGDMATYENPDLPPDIEETFWQQVVDCENAPQTCEAEELRKAGLVFPPAEELSDDALPAKLWELIEALARRSTYLYQTDHLSDRELYMHLTKESLWEIESDLPRGDDRWRMTIDLIGSGSDEDIDLYYTYYADDKDRAHWLAQFPDYRMPEPKPKPFDRDRLLPIPPDEARRRAWLADMHAQGYSDADIDRICCEEMEREFPAIPEDDSAGDEP